MIRRLKNEWRYLTGAYEKWQNDDAPLMAAAVAYYVGLSLFPMLLVLIAGVGLVLRYTDAGQDAERQVITAIAENVSPTLETHLKNALQAVQDRSLTSGRIGILGILFTAVVAFAQFQAAFDRIWNVPPPSSKGILAGLRRIVIERGIAFLMLLAMGLLVVIVFLSGLVLSHLRAFAHDLLPATDILWSIAPTIVTLVLNALIFSLIYRWLPKADVRWGDALRGGVLAAIGWEVGRQLLAAFLIGTRYSSAYGVVGSFIAILLWCYYAIAVLFFGAEYIQEVQRHRNADVSEE